MTTLGEIFTPDVLAKMIDMVKQTAPDTTATAASAASTLSGPCSDGADVVNNTAIAVENTTVEKGGPGSGRYPAGSGGNESGGGTGEPKPDGGSAKAPWQMTRSEFRIKENTPVVDKVKEALASGKKIYIRTPQRVTPLSKPEQIRIGPKTGTIFIPEGRGREVALTQDQVDDIYDQAGGKPVPMQERIYHQAEVKEALKAGKDVSPEVLADYPRIQQEIEDEKADAAMYAEIEAERNNKSITKADESVPFVAQVHFRGKGAHLDVRIKNGDALDGWTVAVAMPDKIKEPVETLEQAEAALRLPTAWKINWQTGAFKNRNEGDTVSPSSLYAEPKNPEDTKWLDFEGVTPAGIEKGGPGSGRYPAGSGENDGGGKGILLSSGATVPLFHGTKSKFTEFNTPLVHLTTDISRAEHYSQSEQGGRVLDVAANIKNPLYSNDAPHEVKSQEWREAQKQGYDAIVFSQGGRFDVVVPNTSISHVTEIPKKEK